MHSVMMALFPLQRIEFVYAHKEIVQQKLSFWQVRAGQDAPPTVLYGGYTLWQHFAPKS